MPFGIFHPTRLKQFEPKPQGLKVLKDYLWMSPEYTQQTFFSTFSILFFRANIIWHILGNHFMEERKKKRTKTFLMANASGSLHDAYESAYLIWRKTFFASQSSEQHLAVFFYIHKITLCSFLTDGLCRDGWRQPVNWMLMSAVIMLM